MERKDIAGIEQQICHFSSLERQIIVSKNNNILSYLGVEIAAIQMISRLRCGLFENSREMGTENTTNNYPLLLNLRVTE